jgi:transcriptional regulator with XRE-family HTH domain
LRKASGMTREQLASRADLTFQQIQKYETGQNRMSAGRLAELAAILGVSPADFYFGAGVLQQVIGERTVSPATDAALERDVCDLLIAYLQIGSEEERRKVLAIVRAASDRRVNDRAGAIFISRRRFAGEPPDRMDQAGILVSVLVMGSGRIALRNAIAGPVQTSWVKPVVHASGETGSRPQI